MSLCDYDTTTQYWILVLPLSTVYCAININTVTVSHMD
jgi:hypothetical protein